MSPGSSTSSPGGTGLWRFPVQVVLPIQQVPHMELALAGRAQTRDMRLLGSVGFVCVPAHAPVPALGPIFLAKLLRWGWAGSWSWSRN